MSTKRYPDDSAVHRKYYAQIKDRLEQDQYAKHLGIQLIELGEGTATAELVVQEHMLNAHGSAHGAAIFALADFVFAAACNSYGRTSVALSMNIGFMTAAFAGNRLVATATEEKRNNRTSWYRIYVENEQGVVASLDALAYRKNEYFVSMDEEE